MKQLFAIVLMLLALPSESKTIDVGENFRVQSIGEILGSRDVADLQLSKETHRFEFIINNKSSQAKDLVLFNAYPIAKFSLYYRQNDKELVKYGGRYNDGLQEIPFPLPVFKFTASPGESLFILEIEPEGHPLLVSPVLNTPVEFQKFSQFYLSFLYLIFGAFASNILYQIFYGFIAKRKIIVSYALTMGFLMMYLACITGFVYIFPPAISIWFGMNWPITSILAIIAGKFFLENYLDVNQDEFPIVAKLQDYFVYSAGLVLIYYQLPPAMVFTHQIIGVSALGLALFPAFKRFRKGSTSALVTIITFGIPAILLPIQGIVFFSNIEGIEIVQLVMLPLAGYLSSLLFSLGLGFKTREQEQNFEYFRTSLDGVVSDKMRDAILANPEQIKTGVTEARISIMFIDMVGYSRIVRKSSPQKVFDEIKSIMAAIKSIVHQHGGIIDKTLGDGLLCSFGSNLFGDYIPNHEKAAIDCSEDLQNFMVSRILQNDGKPVLPIRIGINTDKVFIGNMGDKKNFDFTLTGEGVVLASRFEAACEPFKVICGEETFNALNQTSPAFNQRLVTVKHEKAPRTAYEYDPFYTNPEDLERARQAFFHSHDLSNTAKRFICHARIAIGSSYGEFDIINFSLGGMAIEGTTFIGCQSEIEIQISGCEPSLDFIMPIKGIVRWGKTSDSGTFIHGVSLLGCSQNVQEALVRHFHSLENIQESSC